MNDLKRALSYSPNTGAFTWKMDVSNKARKGQRAGSLVNKTGCRQIGYKGKTYAEQRLAFNFMNKKTNANEWVYHLNGNKADNRFSNLKRVKKNTYKNKTTGVTFSKSKQRWVANIGLNNKTIHLGVFKTKNEAEKRRKQAEKKFPEGFLNNKGVVKESRTKTIFNSKLNSVKRHQTICKNCKKIIIYFAQRKKIFCSRTCKDVFGAEKDKEFRRIRKKFQVINSVKFKVEIETKFKSVPKFCKKGDILYSQFARELKRGWFGDKMAIKINKLFPNRTINSLTRSKVKAEDIQILRKYLMINQTAFSLLFKVSLTGISFWETGKNLPNNRFYNKFIKNLSNVLVINH